MTIYDVRLNNARELRDRLGRKDEGGQQKFADKLEMSRQQASHIIGDNPIKPIGDKMARRIEQAFGVPVGWLDRQGEGKDWKGEWIEVPLLADVLGEDVTATEPIRCVHAHREWVRMLKPTALEHLALVTQLDDTMLDTIHEGATLIVDRGVTKVEASGVYVLLTGGGTQVRRVQRKTGGGLTVMCDNGKYKPESVSAKDVMIAARVLGALTPTRL